MRILHVLDHSLPLHSGYSFRTIAILREQRALGWATFQMTTPRHGETTSDTESVGGWDFIRTQPRTGWLASVPTVGRYLSEMRSTAERLDEVVTALTPDVIHAHSPVLNALPALWIGRKRRIPVVYEVRALWEDGAVDQGVTRHGSVRYRLSRVLETIALKRSDRVTVICEGLRREVARRGVDENRITVIPNAVDTSAFEFDRSRDAELTRRLGIEESTVLGFVGSFYGYEGLELLIDAFARLVQRRPNLRLLLVGGGPSEPALRARVASQCVEGKVLFAGRVPHGDVQDYYSVIDLLVYPRRRVAVTEIVTPLKPLEAMAQGRLLLASDVGGHCELIRDGETGHLFPAGDVDGLVAKIELILERSNSSDRIRRQARTYVESERTWKLSVARYEAVYEGALNERRGALED